jgi:hypothetical protein
LTRATLPYRALAAVYVALGVAPLANALRRGSVLWWSAAAQEWVIRGSVLLLVLALVVLVFADRTDVAIADARRRLLAPSSRSFVIAVSIFATLAAAALSWYCFSGLPFTSDEMAQQWHARILLSGHLAATPEAAREFFNTAPVFDRDGRWFSQYPIGGPAFVALGLAVRAAWLVNPVLIGVATWQLYRFVSVASEELTARVVTLVFALSPMVLIMAASQMNHVPALAFTLLALAELARWDMTELRAARNRHAAVIGAAIGVVALLRPLDAFVVAIVVGAFQLWRCRGDSSRWPSLVVQAAVGALPIAILLYANWRTTGQPFLFGYEALNGPEHAMGFHIDPNGERHTPLRGLALISGYMMRLSRYLFEWPIPGVLVIAAGLAMVKRPSRWDALLAALSVAFLVAYSAYWFDGFFAGPRFLYTAVPAFVYFAARTPGWFAESWFGRFATARRVALVVIPVCVFVSWLGPSAMSSARVRVASYHAQRTKLKTDVDAQMSRAGVHNALVLVNEGWRGRLQARLRVLGVSQFRAERVLSTVDACALQAGLDADDLSPGPDLHARAERIIATAAAYGTPRVEGGQQADQAIALVPGSRPTPVCLNEFLRDTAGTISYPIFLARQHVNRDGRIGGDIVFARDLGARDTLLRRSFGSRTWYRYRPGRSVDDTSMVLRPYEATP